MDREEQILRAVLPKDHIWEEAGHIENTPIAMIAHSMAEYAKEQAVKFAEYISGQGWQQYDGADRWINVVEGNAVLETQKLYEKFINQ